MSDTDKTLKLADFKYVDFWYTDINGKNHEWTRIEVGEVAKYQQEHALNFNCFITVQRYANSTRTKGESYAAPLFFDLDYKENPQIAKDEAVRIVDFFLHELDLKESDIWVYFSGSKGFHILIANQAIGIEPRNDLHKAFNHIANYLKYRLGDRITESGPDGENREKIIPLKSIDPAVYTSARMLRLPNSIHQNTRLFKIELTIEELRLLNLEQIKELAKQPRKDVGLSGEDRKKALKLRKFAFALYVDKLKEYEQAEATSTSRYSNEVYYFDKQNPPVCVLDILKGGWKKDGDRNQATVQLACYYKDAGFTKEETAEVLTDWVIKHTSADTKYSSQQRVANTRSVIDAVYGQENAYRFGCAFIRSLHGPKQPGNDEYDRVACTYELCPCLKQNNEVEEEATALHLAQTGKAEFTGKLVKTRIMVAGKKHTPYIVPKKVEYSCWGKKNCKKVHCPLYNIENGTIYKALNVQDRELLQMCGVGDDNIKGILRQVSTIPACQRFDMTTVESVNLDELLTIPMAEDNDIGAIDEKAVTEGKYVLRKIYSVGDLNIQENKYYEIDGYVFPHPKNQEGTIIIKAAKPLQDVVERFKITDEIKENLKIFRPHEHTQEAIYEKLQAIMDDLTYNVTHIVERDEVLLGVLLTYHSVLRFTVPWDNQPIRGWVEMKILGDTATGKSALIEKVQKFVGLGTRVNAESTSRTGLTYKMEQSGTGGAWYIVWGAWPLADRELIWIDEDTGITKDEYGEMTLARSDGKLEVKRAVTAETPCRVRAILSGNVPHGKRLSDYTQGVEALKDIFNNEDIRRFDFATFMRYSDVDPELYNQKLKTYPVQITAELLKDNILFAWSRKTDDVIITADAQDKILEGATELSRLYGNASDIPLVTPSDQRNKIARLSVALSALLHSTDESGERIQVWPGHVDFIISYLKGVYNAGGCGLNYYAKLCVKEEELDDPKYQKLTEKLKEVDTLKGEIKFTEFLNLFARTKYLRQSDLEAMLAISKEEAKAVATALTRLKMVEVTTGGYRKTARFNAYIAKAFELGLFDNYEDEL